jgi:hypothetical protein
VVQIHAIRSEVVCALLYPKDSDAGIPCGSPRLTDVRHSFFFFVFVFACATQTLTLPVLKAMQADM